VQVQIIIIVLPHVQGYNVLLEKINKSQPHLQFRMLTNFWPKN